MYCEVTELIIFLKTTPDIKNFFPSYYVGKLSADFWQRMRLLASL